MTSAAGAAVPLAVATPNTLELTPLVSLEAIADIAFILEPALAELVLALAAEVEGWPKPMVVTPAPLLLPLDPLPLLI